MHLTDFWYQKGPVSFALWPLSLLYCAASSARRRKLSRLQRAPVGKRGAVPVIVVGNISVGGTGKTPMVIWLEQLLVAHGYHPGIVSRGYGGEARQLAPLKVEASSDARQLGDEPVVMRRRVTSPVWVCVDRVAAIEALLESAPDTDVIISDDGLQHYRMHRDIEIAMIDGARRFGNGLCLPAGPLRETEARLDSVDFRVVTGMEVEQGEYASEIIGETLVNLLHPEQLYPLHELSGATVHAVAGLGNPQRFFNKLELAGLTLIRHRYPDHHGFTASDIRFEDDYPVIMTEKDAVKCLVSADQRHWYLPVKARPDAALAPAIIGRLKEICRGQKIA